MSASRPWVALRCDAGPEIGAGHLVRSLALAEGFLRCGVRPVIITGPLPPAWRAMAADRGVELEEIAGLVPGDVGRPGARLEGGAPPLLAVLDGYELAGPQIEAWRRHVGFAGLIADYGPGHGADAVVDHRLCARADEYPEVGQRVLGPAYALLREEFREKPAPRPDHDPPVVLVSLGGSITSSMRPLVLAGLEAAGVPLAARIVVAPHDEPGPETRGGDVSVQWLPTRPTLREELEGADLALIAAGGTRFEAARLGVPMILGVLAENQREDAHAFAAAGAALLLGWWRETDATRIGEALRTLIRDADARRTLAARARDLVDGCGAERAARALLDAARRVDR